MFAAVRPQLSPLDVPTLSFVAICIAALLGLLLIFAWLQQRNVRALAWWGSAYLIGASSIALWGAPAPLFAIAAEFAQALIFVACGMIWNGVRLFHGRPLLPIAAFAGAVVWLVLCQLPRSPKAAMSASRSAPWWSRPTPSSSPSNCGASGANRSYSRTAAIVVPCVHAAIFLMPLAMQAFLPAAYAGELAAVFALETMLYAVGTAFIVLLMVKDNDVTSTATPPPPIRLTGLLNRRAFLEGALSLCARQANAASR